MRKDVEAIATAGNAIGVVSLTTHGGTCGEGDPSSAVEVQLGSGASLGPAQTVASEDITNGTYATIARPKGFAIDAGGTAALLTEEPQDTANNSLPFLYFQAGGAGPGPEPGPAAGAGPASPLGPGASPPASKPLPAPAESC